jgi:CRISPR-associated protein Cst2
MSELKPVYALSISGRMTLEMHSLNNEGGEGNQITTRTVALVEPDGTVHKVNAVSGDMFKHIQAEHLYLRARGHLPLCAGCQAFRADRALADERFSDKNLPKTDAETIDLLLQVCALDDMEGNLIARGARSIPRKSVAEFGWVVGLPEKVRTESYFHVRYAAERGVEGAEQPIFHRPASSGVYAAVAHLELARIGFNDITQTYPLGLDEEQRLARYRAFLESVLYTFVEPNGAMRSTQNPHIVAFEGVVTVSHQVMPAPALSPLNDGYREEIVGVAQALSRGRDGAVSVYQFDTMSQFADILQTIVASTHPYRLFA